MIIKAKEETDENFIDERNENNIGLILEIVAITIGTTICVVGIPLLLILKNM